MTLLQIAREVIEMPHLPNWITAFIVGITSAILIFSFKRSVSKMDKATEKLSNLEIWKGGIDVAVVELRRDQDNLSKDHAEAQKFYYALGEEMNGVASREWVKDWTKENFESKKNS